MASKSCKETFDSLILDGFNLLSAYEKELNNEYENFENISLVFKENIEKIINNRAELKSKSDRRRKKDVEKTNQTLESVSETTEETDVSSLIQSSEKPRRMASQIASLLFKKQAESFHGKLRRPEESNDITSHCRAQIIREVIVKQEKSDPIIEESNSTELMPPPEPVKTKKGRTKKIKSDIDSSDTDNETSKSTTTSTRVMRSKIRQNKNIEKDEPKRSTRNRRKKNDSDVIILPSAPVPRITISDNENEQETDQDTHQNLTTQDTQDIVDNVNKIENINDEIKTVNITEEIVKNTVAVLIERLPLNEINKIKEVEQKEVFEKPDDSNKKKNIEVDKTVNIEDDKSSGKKEKKTELNKKTKKGKNLEVDSQESASELEKENINEDEDKENANKNENVKKHARTWSSEDEENHRSNKRTKKTKTNKKTNKKAQPIVEKIPFVSLENIKIEKDVSLYEDALSNSIEANNQTYAIQNLATPTMNSTVTISKGPNFNSTFSKGPVLNQTVTFGKADTPKFQTEESESDLLKKHGLTKCTVQLENKIEIENIKKYICESESSPELKDTEKNKAESEVLSPIIKSPTWKKPVVLETNQNDSLFTEDDSDVSPIKNVKPKNKSPKQKKTQKFSSSSQSSEKTTPKDKKSKRAIKTKPMFSPYANSPVKKRVAAFEKLQEKTEIPTTSRVTRTKKRQLMEEKEKEIRERKENSQIPQKTATTKFITPMGNHKLKSMIPSTDSKIARPGLMSSKNNLQNSSAISTSSESLQRTQSAVKLTRKELQEKREEEQKRKLEKEDEVRKKKEVMLQAKIEEQKRLREEKMLRAKELREENERKKEERLRQALIEKEEKIREEQERKKAYYAQKAVEMEEHRKLVEKNKLAKQREEMLRQKEEEEQKRLALKKQMEAKHKKKYKPPPLPTADNSDTDSEDENSVRKRVPAPSWAHKQRLYPVLASMSHIPNSILVNFYNIEPTTPDLSQIFEYIPQHYLKRNSSAVWRTPPRYSTLPKF